MIYLKPREKRRMFVVNKYDTPFQEDIFFNESFEDALKRISILTGLKNVKPKFICKYLYEHINIRRMMFVYIINLNDELNLKLRFPKAKLWTEAQIKDNIGKDCFGNCFEQEFELLESVVFPALKIMNDDQKDDNNIGADSIG